VIGYGRKKGVDVIIMDEKFKALRPQLVSLFEQAANFEDLIPIFTTEREKKNKIILYKLLPEK